MPFYKVYKKPVFLLSLLFLLIVVGFFFLILNLYKPKSKAGGSYVGFSVNLQPQKESYKIGEEFDVVVRIAPENTQYGISGVKLVFLTSSENLEFVSLSNESDYYRPLPIDADKNIFERLERQVTRRQVLLTYVAKTKLLPKAVVFKLRLKGKGAGDYSLQLNKDLVEIVGDIPTIKYSLREFNPVKVKVGSSTISQKIDENVRLSLKLRLQGITQKPRAREKLPIQIRVWRNSMKNECQPDYCKNTEFRVDDKGIFSGNVEFNVNPADDYILFIKGPKHLQRKICDLNQNTDQGAVDNCSLGKIRLRRGDNVFDLTYAIIMAGDVPPQDDKVDAYDLGVVRNCLGKTEKECLTKADFNEDGVVDTADFALASYTLYYQLGGE